MLRKLIGLVAGLVVAMITIMTVEAIANRMYGDGLAMDPSATVATAQQPAGLLLMVLVGWLLAGLLGGATAIHIARVKIVSWGVAAAILIGVALRFATESQPGWMFIAGPIAPLLGALLSQLLVRATSRGRRPGS
jgi:hypothetical protein